MVSACRLVEERHLLASSSPHLLSQAPIGDRDRPRATRRRWGNFLAGPGGLVSATAFIYHGFPCVSCSHSGRTLHFSGTGAHEEDGLRYMLRAIHESTTGSHHRYLLADPSKACLLSRHSTTLPRAQWKSVSAHYASTMTRRALLKQLRGSQQPGSPGKTSSGLPDEGKRVSGKQRGTFSR